MFFIHGKHWYLFLFFYKTMFCFKHDGPTFVFSVFKYHVLALKEINGNTLQESK